jgi:feruloyl-CoA synthase
MTCNEALAPHRPFLTDALEHWASETPSQVFLTEATAGDERTEITYAQTLHAVRAIGQALVDRGLGAARPVAILSENSIAAGLITLACQYAGVPAAPISPPYALLSQDFARLRGIIDDVCPALVFAADAQYETAIVAAVPAGTEIVLAAGALQQRASTLFTALLTTVPGAALERAKADRRPGDVAKILFTSGSSGTPKGVVNTHAMLTSNQQMMRQSFAFLQDEKPVMVDWLPWHHTFGGNHNFGIALYNGGTFHIDAGRPTPAAIARTVATLRHIAPTLYFNVPRGYDMLLAELNRDHALARTFFSRVKFLYYAGAALSPPTWHGLTDAAVRACGERVLLLTGLGSTETGPFAVAGLRDADRPGEIGLPAPGNTLKLVPNGEKLELRLRSPSVTAAYWQRPDLTQAAFDEEGFYCIGDAVRFIDPAQPARGLRFDGRVAEDFKLSTGVWVNVAQLRARVLTALAPLIQEVIIAGHDRDEAAALVVANPAACEAAFGAAPGPAQEAALTEWLRARLQHLGGAGSSERVTRLAVLRRPLSLDQGEITDKGSVNVRRVIELRAAVVGAAYEACGVMWEVKGGLLF